MPRGTLFKKTSYAFGKENKKTATYEEPLTELPKNIAISCTALIDENDLCEEEIDVEVDLIKKDVCNDGFCDDINDDELRQLAKLELIKKKWNGITRTMDFEKLKSPYNLGINNCCTVAYKGAATLFDSNENKVREKVNPKTFNVYGMGVVWSNYIFASSWGLSESSNSRSYNSQTDQINHHNPQEGEKPNSTIENPNVKDEL